MIKVLLLLSLFNIIGCASIVAHSPSNQKRIDNLPPSAQVQNVPFISQKKDFCGPSTLAMVMQFYGKDVSAEQLSKLLFVQSASGTFQQDMISAARLNQFITIPIENYADLFQEISSGNPVIVFRNLGFDWVPLWHYSVITGYDKQQQTITMHSGADKDSTMKLVDFDNSWERANFWAFSIIKPGMMSQNASAMDLVRSAAAFENIKSYKAAIKTYESITRKWPSSEIAYYGLGNIYFKKNSLTLAIKNYERAIDLKENFPEAWFNLALSYKASKKLVKYKQAAKMAIAKASPDKRDQYIRDLN